MLVTVKLLKEIDACSNQVDLFQELYPQGIDIPEDSVETQKVYDEAGKGGLDIRWWLEEMKLTGVVKQWYSDGKPKYEAHYQDGALHDSKGRTPAEKWWYPDGESQCEIYYQNGYLQDLKDGTAAVRKWYPDGKPKYEYHYQDGVIQC